MTRESRRWLQISVTTNSNFNSQIMSLVSALNESDDLETLENSSEDSATDLETDFEKHDDGIGFSAPAGLLKTTTRRELRTKSDLCVTLHASWFIHECQRTSVIETKQTKKTKHCSCVKTWQW